MKRFFLIALRQIKYFSNFKTVIALILISFSINSSGQLFLNHKPKETPDTIYHELNDNSQLIEIDYLATWKRIVGFLDATQPRALPWNSVIPPHQANIYIIRDSVGKITKIYNHPFFNSPDSMVYELYGKNLLTVEKTKYQKENMLIKLHSNFLMIYNSDSICLKKTGFFDHFDFSQMKSCKKGLIDSSGRIILQPEYDIFIPFESIILLGKDGKIGVIDKKLKEVVPMKYDLIYPSSYNYGMLDIKLDNKWGLIDTKGKKIVKIKKDKIIDYKVKKRKLFTSKG